MEYLSNTYFILYAMAKLVWNRISSFGKTGIWDSRPVGCMCNLPIKLEKKKNYNLKKFLIEEINYF